MFWALAVERFYGIRLRHQPHRGSRGRPWRCTGITGPDLFRRAGIKDLPPFVPRVAHGGHRLSEVEAFESDGKFHSCRQAGWV